MQTNKIHVLSNVYWCELNYVLVIFLKSRHRPVIVIRAVIGSEGRWKLIIIFKLQNALCDWSIIKKHGKEIIYLLHVLKQHFTAFVY